MTMAMAVPSKVLKTILVCLPVLVACIFGHKVVAEQTRVVTLQLNWKHQFEFAAFYAAIQQGFYREAGLEVILVEGGPGISVVDEVVSGNADFAVGNSSLVLDYVKGKPLVVLAALMQHSAISMLAKRDHGIENIFDLFDAFRKGTTGSIEAVVVNKDKIRLGFSLSGFTSAVNGLPVSAQ